MTDHMDPISDSRGHSLASPVQFLSGYLSENDCPDPSRWAHRTAGPATYFVSIPNFLDSDSGAVGKIPALPVEQETSNRPQVQRRRVKFETTGRR